MAASLDAPPAERPRTLGAPPSGARRTIWRLLLAPGPVLGRDLRVGELERRAVGLELDGAADRVQRVRSADEQGLGLVVDVAVDLLGERPRAPGIDRPRELAEHLVELRVRRAGAEAAVVAEELAVHERGRVVGRQVEPGVDQDVPRRRELLLD